MSTAAHRSDQSLSASRRRRRGGSGPGGRGGLRPPFRAWVLSVRTLGSSRFQREAQVLASLNHPGIAAIYGIEEQDDTRALVLEFVEGPTLAERISAALKTEPDWSALPSETPSALGK